MAKAKSLERIARQYLGKDQLELADPTRADRNIAKLLVAI